MTIDEYQSARRQTSKGNFGYSCVRKSIERDFENRPERQLGYGRHIGDPPVFLLKSGKTQLRKPSDTCLAQRKNPGWLLGLLFKPLKFFQIWLCFLHRGVCCDLNHSWRSSK